MATNSRDDLPPDPVRDALNAIHKGGFSWRKIWQATRLDKGEYKIHEDTLRKYAAGDSTHTSKETWKRLAEFIDSSAGKRMRELASISNHSSSDRLIDTLSSGNETKTPNSEVAGLYFVYHGSYLLERHYAVRVMEIAQHGNMLSVTDTIKEQISGHSGPHIAYGCAVFFDHPPRLHIVTDAEDHDNRHGLGLFIGTSPIFSGNVLTEVVGTVSGMTKGGRPFSRHCIVVRHAAYPSQGETEEYKQARTDMIDHTGVFPIDQPKSSHVAPLDKLVARLMVSDNREPFADPILSRVRSAQS